MGIGISPVVEGPGLDYLDYYADDGPQNHQEEHQQGEAATVLAVVMPEEKSQQQQDYIQELVTEQKPEEEIKYVELEDNGLVVQDDPGGVTESHEEQSSGDAKGVESNEEIENETGTENDVEKETTESVVREGSTGNEIVEEQTLDISDGEAKLIKVVYKGSEEENAANTKADKSGTAEILLTTENQNKITTAEALEMSTDLGSTLSDKFKNGGIPPPPAGSVEQSGSAKKGEKKTKASREKKSQEKDESEEAEEAGEVFQEFDMLTTAPAEDSGDEKSEEETKTDGGSAKPSAETTNITVREHCTVLRAHHTFSLTYVTRRLFLSQFSRLPGRAPTKKIFSSLNSLKLWDPMPIPVR